MNSLNKTAMALLISCGIFSVPVTAQSHGGAPLEATMTGVDGGDPDGSGHATLHVNPGQGSICYEIRVENIEPATAAHIHGGPLIHLAAPTSGVSHGCALGIDREFLVTLLQNPENYYVNVHNASYPPGAVSGTLTR